MLVFDLKHKQSVKNEILKSCLYKLAYSVQKQPLLWGGISLPRKLSPIKNFLCS